MTDSASQPVICRKCPDQYSAELLTEGHCHRCQARRDKRVAEVQSWLRSPDSFMDSTDLLTAFIDRLEAATSAAVSTVGELKKHSNKAKGDYFEIFSLLYLVETYDWVMWRLADAPEWVLQECKLERTDLGVDLIGWCEEGWIAVQAKFRKPTERKEYSCVGWRELSTFYSRTDRSGPWYRRIVITTARGIRHVGEKSPGDRTIAHGTLSKIDRTVWLRMSGSVGQALGGVPKGEAPPKLMPKPKPVGHVLSTGAEVKKAPPRPKKTSAPKKTAAPPPPPRPAGQALSGEARPLTQEELRERRLAKLA